jgi:hypothetical protein
MTHEPPVPAPVNPTRRVADLPLRETERRQTLGTIDRPAAAMATRVAAGARAGQPHRSSSATPVRKAAGNIATVRPGAPRSAAYAVPDRPASTWSWLKEALFGVAPEVERR